MSKAVMISTHPIYCELIESGEKTIEVRKTAPKLRTPFKCHIYCTLSGSDEIAKDLPKWYREKWYEKKGEVIGEFVCDRIDKYEYSKADGADIDDDTLLETMLDREEINIYAHGKDLYGWHISDLKIYDTPKELGEFSVHCKEWDKVDYLPEELKCRSCRYCQRNYDDYDPNLVFYNPICYGSKPLTRPPQSWCYVEPLGV